MQKDKLTELTIKQSKPEEKEYKLSDNVVREAFNWNSEYRKV